MSSSDPTSFNLNDQQAVVSLLSLVRGSTLDLDDKNLIRDLVLDYVRTKDPAIVDQLTVYLAAINVVATTESEPKPESSTPSAGVEDVKEQSTITDQSADIPAGISFSPKSIGIGTRRPKPSFRMPDALVKKSATDTPTSTAVEESAPTTPLAQQKKSEGEATSQQDTTVAVEHNTSLEAIAAPATDVPESIPKPVVPPQPVQPVADVAVSDSEPLSTETSPSAAPATEVPVSDGGSTDHLRRIKEIKHAVNVKIGNPVHLVEADNTIGREYMNALLQAMKMVSMDSPVDAQLAMDRLEAAFEKVKALLAHSDTRSSAHTTPDSGTPENLPVQNQPAKPAPTADTARSVPDTAPSKKDPVDSPVAPKVPDSSNQESTPTSGTTADTVVTLNTDANTEPPPLAAAYQAAKEKEGKPAEEAVEPNEPDAGPSVRKLVPNQPPAPVSQATDVPTSVASDSKLPQPPVQPAPRPQPTPEQSPVAAKPHTVLASAKPTTEEVAQPLETNSLQAQLQEQMEKNKQEIDERIYTPEVTSGLEQLLSEWEIFRRSGIFGTGPSGIDHPLYKTLKDLTMTTVIAGRFDGVNSVIRQSIADYMQGWHNEQGITYEHTETFERYLRRVIRRILDDYKRTH